MKQVSKKSKPQLPFINPEKLPLTPEKLLEFPGCGHYSPEEAIAVVESIQRFVAILLDFHHNQSICIDNQHFVSLEQQSNPSRVISLPSKKLAA